MTALSHRNRCARQLSSDVFFPFRLNPFSTKSSPVPSLRSTFFAEKFYRSNAPRFISSTPSIPTESEAPASLIAKLENIVSTNFPVHPFSHLVLPTNSERVMKSYFAMSQAFPYIQAGAYQKLIVSAMHRNQDISPQIERTFVIGSFLCWDETGSHHLLQQKGKQALPEILNTNQFHANMLRADLRKIFNRELKPEYCRFTLPYLLELSARLGDENNEARCAGMVAFEMHANHMITALWDSLTNIHKLEKKDLAYFEAHVGGDDPAEAYHVAMTKRLIALTVKNKDQDVFLEHFKRNYLLNSQWCEDICHNM